jgi:hypothetical protein
VLSFDEKNGTTFSIRLVRVRLSQFEFTVKHQMVLQEGLENEKVGLERDREMAIKHSYNVQERFSKEFELALDGWKQAMNTEISKAKEVADELQEQLLRRTLFEPDNPNLQVSSMGFVDQPDLKNYMSKVSWSNTQLFFNYLVPTLSCS